MQKMRDYLNEDKDKITVPNKLLFARVLEYIQQGKNVTIRVKGGSMKPFLRDGDRVLLKSFERRELTRGIIVLAKTDDSMVLHRVVRYDSQTIWLAGDDNLVQHEIVNCTDVIATAVRLYRADREVKLDKRWRYITGQIWYWLRPFRRIARKLIYVIK